MAHSSRAGFTIIEILVVLAISVSLIFVISSFSGNLSTLQNLVSQKLQSRADVDQTLQIMSSEIRSASPSGLGAYPIDTATTSTFIFYSDINKNGIMERVRYSYGTSTIIKGVTTPSGNPFVYNTSTEVVTTVVANVAFATTTQFLTYYGSNYTGSEAPLAFPIDVSQVRVVKINFYSDINPNKSPQPIFFSDEVAVRNLRSN